MNFIEAQTISGRVFDASTKEPLPFVSISIKNTTKGTSSKIDGTFSLSVPSKDIDLNFSMLGYFPKVLKARNYSEVFLEEKDNQLNEIVVRAINPAHRIIEAAVRNKPHNDPEQIPSFRYEVYHKSIVSANIDSLNTNKFTNCKTFIDK